MDAERKYIRSWLEMGFDPSAVHLAYEKTLMATGKLTWAYLNRILLSWHEKGLHTPAEVQTADRKPGTQASASGYTLGESELSAIANLQKLRDSLKEE